MVLECSEWRSNIPVPFQASQTTPGAKCSEMNEKDVRGRESCLTLVVIPANALSAYSIPGTVLNSLCVLSLLILTIVLWGRCCSLFMKSTWRNWNHFTDKSVSMWLIIQGERRKSINFKYPAKHCAKHCISRVILFNPQQQPYLETIVIPF